MWKVLILVVHVVVFCTHFNGTVIAILLSVAMATTTNMLTRIRNPIDPPYSLPRHWGKGNLVGPIFIFTITPCLIPGPRRAVYYPAIQALHLISATHCQLTQLSQLSQPPIFLYPHIPTNPTNPLSTYRSMWMQGATCPTAPPSLLQ